MKNIAKAFFLLMAIVCWGMGAYKSWDGELDFLFWLGAGWAFYFIGFSKVLKDKIHGH